MQISDAKRFEQLTHLCGVVLLKRMPKWIDGRASGHHDVGHVARMLRHEAGDVVDAGTVRDPDLR